MEDVIEIETAEVALHADEEENSSFVLVEFPMEDCKPDQPNSNFSELEQNIIHFLSNISESDQTNGEIPLNETVCIVPDVTTEPDKSTKKKTLKVKNFLDQYVIKQPYNEIQCYECGKTFSQQSNLNKHMRLHTWERSYSCQECNKTFSNYFAFKKHHRIHREGPLTCQVCGKFCRKPSTLEVHMRSHTGEKPFVCKQCGTGFARLHSLKIHTMIHTGERKFSCEDCGKLFRHHSALVVHRRIHSGEKPFQCSMCDISFSDNSALQRHTNVHSKEKKFQCQVCNKSFKYSNNLTQHMRIHSGERPFQCDNCGKAYRTAWSLSQHVRTHLAGKVAPTKRNKKCPTKMENIEENGDSSTAEVKENPFTCNECGKCFSDYSSVSRHMFLHLENDRLNGN